MAGPYAHITLLHELMRTNGRVPHFSPASGFDAALADYFPYVVLGSVSPDYPNLARDNGSAACWADSMHCTRTCEMIMSGIRRVRAAQGAVRDKQLAWLLGYCAHVVTDVTIHPVVQAKVGTYAENQRRHRICEMNQDSYIYQRMKLGEIGESDSFALTIARCGSANDKTRLDDDIVSLWHGMLKDVHPEQFTAQPPGCAAWHREFATKAADCRAGEVRLFPLAGIIAAKTGADYPLSGAIDRQYIDWQTVPMEKPCNMGYDAVFDHAVDNVATMWRWMERTVCAADPTLYSLGDWNLDTGRDVHGDLVFW